MTQHYQTAAGHNLDANGGGAARVCQVGHNGSNSLKGGDDMGFDLVQNVGA